MMNTQNLVLLEEFLIRNIHTIFENRNNTNFSLKPDEIKNILMNNPFYLNNAEYAIEYLISSNEIPSNKEHTISFFKEPSISFDFLQKKLSKFHFLSETRIKYMEDFIKTDVPSFSIKKIESTIINNQPAYAPDLLIFTYSILMMIIRSDHDKKDNPDYSIEKVKELITFFREYSIQSTFSPINTNFIRQIDNSLNVNLSLFARIPSGSSRIFRRGVVSNGNFIFVLHSDFYLSIFPISIENGGFLSPMMCKLDIEENVEITSVSLISDKLILTSPHITFCYSITSLLNSPHSVDTEIQANNTYSNKMESFTVTDGVVNVIIKEEKELLIATVKSIDAENKINKVSLHKNKDEKLYDVYPFGNYRDLISWPAETNGIILSFYIKIDQSHILCRQFSLINGCHLNDQMIDTNIRISAICYDSINQMHYVAIDKNGQLIIYGLSGSSDCSLNPSLFDFCFFDLNQNFLLKQKKFSLFQKADFLKEEKEFAYLVNSILLSSIFSMKDIGTFIIEEKENVTALPLLFSEIIKLLNYGDKEKNKEKETVLTNIKLASLQIIAILLVINIRHHYLLLTESKEDQEYKIRLNGYITEMLLRLSTMKTPYSLSFVSFIILNLFDLIDFVNDKNYQAFIEGLLISCSPTLLKYIIHVLFKNSDKFSFLSFTNVNNIFAKYFDHEHFLSNVHPNIISFLLCHQRCVINQLHLSLKKELFSSTFNFEDCKTENKALNNFDEYTNFLTNQLTNAISYSSSFSEFKEKTAYFLFMNFLSLISGLYIYHEIAQIVTPLLHVIQNSLQDFFYKNKIVILNNQEAQEILTNIALAFGAFTGTLIKGGNYSSFDEKYKWLIRPNMNLINHPNLLSELDNPTSNVDTFDENVRLFLSDSSDELINGKKILQDIYKKWNVSMNKNLKSPFLELDQLFFAVELYHLNLFENAKSRDLTPLRPALQQMMRVRNSARLILRSNDPIRNVQIIDDSTNKEDQKKNKKDFSFSPFDLIVIKCKMLLRLTSKFDNSNLSIAPKLLADFVLSTEQPSTFINYISNQKNRLQLTNIGFSLIESSYSSHTNEHFLQVVDASLSIAVDNFDGLSAIIRYDHLHKSESDISLFLSRALKSTQYPYLSFIAYKLIKSEVLPKEIIGNSIKPFVLSSINDIKLFAIFYNKYSYISDIFINPDVLYFNDSKTGRNVPFVSISEDDLFNISNEYWYIISNAFSRQIKEATKCFSKVFNFFLNSNFNSENLQVLNHIANCICSFYESIDNSYPIETVKKDFILLLDNLSKLLALNDNLEKASAIVMIFRRILNQKKLSHVLTEIFMSYKLDLNSSKNDDILCAIFAVLGGFIDVIQPFHPVFIRFNREQIQRGILISSNEALLYPFDEETKPINISDKKVYADSLFGFNCSMFPEYEFISSFIDYATKDLSRKVSLIYLNSLSFYLKDENFIKSFSSENASVLIQRLSPLMNPFDTLKDTQKIISFLSSIKKTKNLQDCNFSIMSNKELTCTTYLSPILKGSQANINFETDKEFNGYYGIIADCPFEKQFPYIFVNCESGIVYPNFLGLNRAKVLGVKTKSIHFLVNSGENCIITHSENPKDQVRIEYPMSEGQIYKYRVFICSFDQCHVKSIKVNSPDSQRYNTMNQFVTNCDYFYPPIYKQNRMKSLIEYPRDLTKHTVDEITQLLIKNEPIYFYSLVKVSYDSSPLYEPIGIENILFNFTQADTISEDYYDSIFCHIYSKLTTQMASLIMMELVNIGFGFLLFNHDPSCLIKLFSYCQVPLELFSHEKLMNDEFPFNFDESILNENCLTVHNQQFYNLEFEMKKCLHLISKINQKDGNKISKDFNLALKKYIEDMSNNLNVHTLRNNYLNTSYHDLSAIQSQLTLNIPSSAESMIVSTPFLNNFKINSIMNSSNEKMRFPFIIDKDVTIDITQIKKENQSISTLIINRFDNNWVFGTEIELLLLLKEYYLNAQDPVFFRKKLIDFILIDSPFVSIFVSKLLIHYGQDIYLAPPLYDPEYIMKLFLLFSLIHIHKEKVDQNLINFIEHERCVLCYPIIGKIAPYFPEFYGDNSNNKPDPNIKFEIEISNLDIIDKSKDILSDFIMYSQMISEKESIKKYSLEIIKIWLSISIFYMKGYDSHEDGIFEIKGNSSLNCEFYPAKIHDVFFNDIEIFTSRLTIQIISDIVSSIPEDLFKSFTFQPFSEFVFSMENQIKSLFPPRVLLLLTFFVHRINNIYMFHKNDVPSSLWNRVTHLLPLTEANESILRDISVLNTNQVHFTLNRFESHRISIEGTGKQSGTMIAQVSRALSSNPKNFRQKDILPWMVKFINEKAIDCGGPGRELFSEISMSIIDPISGLFILSPNGRNRCGSENREVYIPFHSKSSEPQKKLIEMNKKEQDTCYRAIGVFIGIVMRTGYSQDLPFAPFVWDAIAGRTIDERAIFSVDERFKEFITNLRECQKDVNLFNSHPRPFRWEIENWDGTVSEVTNPTSSQIVLHEQIDTFISNSIRKRIGLLTDKIYLIRNGFYENIGFSSPHYLTGRALSSLCQGSNMITVDELRERISYRIGDYRKTYFWECLALMSYKQRSLLLKFITGLTKLPKSDHNFRIIVSDRFETDKLPEAATCFNTLFLPEYSSPEIAMKMIIIAIESCQTMEIA
ncbi:hypothetical protein M9Y10_039650 [Tritrichomonas musculus]|uniref:HECT domain-containing protein n=1 Tax=Tritrichomonas musculus TaxID=1915356 RepID=A0ABR2GSU6_9EUKA